MISQDRYVDIKSGVGGGAGVATRQLILRLITQNSLLPVGINQEFTNPDDVGNFFGVQSEEYARAVKYFGFISKSIRSPSRISFVRWAVSATPPVVTGNKTSKDVAALKAIGAAGTMTVTVDGVDVVVTPIKLDTITTLTDAATAIQTACRASTNAQLKTSSTVTFNTNTNQFVLTGGVSGSGYMVPKQTGDAKDISNLIGFLGDGVVTTKGQTADTAVQAIARAEELDNNFGSFAFCLNQSPQMTDDDIVAVANWNKAKNNMYMYLIQVTESARDALSAKLIGLGGTGITQMADGKPDDYADQCPAEILAATDYDATKATQNYMFYEFGNRTPAVTSNPGADAADKARTNYIGTTQTAGQKLSFYQRGVLCGTSTDALDMNIYANEMWLKDYIGAQFMSAFMSLPTIPANDEGKAMLLTSLQASVDKAKDNGTISAGKTLNTVQKLYISQITGDPMAWHQVGTNGFWFTVDFLSRQNPNDKNRTEWYAKYLLVYSKDDAIRAVEGQDVLI